MTALIRRGRRVQNDPWLHLHDEEELPQGGHVIVSLDRLESEAPILLGSAVRLGVRVTPGEAVERLAPHRTALDLVALDFPAFTDGRAFSSARILRERLGFAGEIRAEGQVISDQIGHLIRCGFDAAWLRDNEPESAWRRAAQRFSHVYQPGADRRRALLQGRTAGEGEIARWNDRLKDAGANDVVKQALAAHPGRIAVVASFGAESAALLSVVARADPATPVLFLDTGKHFADTLDYQKALSAFLGLTDVRILKPEAADLSARDPRGDLWRRSPDACCAIRRVWPLRRALSEFDAWFTGRKRFHGGERAELDLVDSLDGKLRFNPLARWSLEEVEAEYDRLNLPRHPLQEEGYSSIGCAPCTAPATNPQDIRAGRWRGRQKTECGIHQSSAFAGRG